MADKRIQFYRGRALQVRERAARMESPGIRKDMEDIARQYDRMADSFEDAGR